MTTKSIPAADIGTDVSAHPKAEVPAHRWGIGAYVLVEGVFLVVAAAAVLMLPSGGIAAVALRLAVPTICAAGLAVLITWWRGNGPRVDLRLTGSWVHVGVGLGFGVAGLLGLTLPVAIVYHWMVGGSAAAVTAFSGLTGSWGWAVTIFLLFVVVGPVCEEIVYRGLLWGAVEQRWGRWAAVIVTTVVFAVAHAEFARLPVLLAATVPIALSRLYSGSLLSSIVAHQVNNFLPGVVIMLSIAGCVQL